MEIETLDQAREYFLTRTQAAAFFNKLASLGYMPQTEEAAMDVLAAGQYLAEADAAQRTKSAALAADPVAAACRELRTAVQQTNGTQPDGLAELHKAADDLLQNDPTMVKALTLLQSAAA